MPARVLLAVSAAVGLALTATAQPAAGRKVALVVGVNEYRNRNLDPLKYAERDATALGDVLKAAGFDVKVLTGGPKVGTGKAAYFAALADALTGVGRADTVLLGFSGHGVQLFVKDGAAEREVPFFCPADAVPTDPATLVSLNDVLKLLDERGGGHNLVLVDACRNVVDPNRGARGGINGTRIDNLPAGTAVFFSCSSRQRARETDKAGGGHGVFFHFVLEGLRGKASDAKGRVTWDRLTTYVKEQVADAADELLADVPAGERQVPFVVGSLGTVPPLVSGEVAKAGPKAGDEKDVEIAAGVTMRFCWVPPGECRLGSPKAERDAVLEQLIDIGMVTNGKEPEGLLSEAEETRGTFRTTGFWLGKYEVTQAEWVALMGSNPSEFDGVKENKGKGVATGRFPVERVSWDDSQAFLKKANAYRGAGGGRLRLPHEDEWEYACRGGKGNGRAFYWGGALNGSQACCNGEFPFGGATKGPFPQRTTAVGSCATASPHPWGLCDMHGNVSEWCENHYSDAGYSLRGGCWYNHARTCRAAARSGYLSHYRGSNGGFRVCLPQN